MNRERKIMLIVLAALLVIVVGTIIALHAGRAPVADPQPNELLVTATPTQPGAAEQSEHDENALGEQAMSEEAGESGDYGELVIKEVPAAAPID